MKDIEKVFLCCPTYDNRMDVGCAAAFYGYASSKRKVVTMTKAKSLLASLCNEFWATCVNAAEEHRFRWFAMLHADIEPEPWWLDTLIDEAESVGADLLSAVVPIKDHRGITSTAIAPELESWSAFGRLTQSQLRHEQFPVTFDINDCADALAQLPEPLRVEHCPRRALWLNTGCFIVRCDKSWSRRLSFEMRDKIYEKDDGTLAKMDWSEDWFFTAKAASLGAKCYGTKKVRVIHKGIGTFHSDRIWGIPTDCNYPTEAMIHG